MSIKSTVFAAVAAAFVALPAFADGIMVQDPYARVSTPMAKSGAAFMTIMNQSGQDDHLLSVSSQIASRTELHTHKDNGEGVMQMLHVEEGFALPNGGMLQLARGGNHVMFMGLTERLEHGKVFSLTLSFEKAGDVVVEVPVDLERKAEAAMDHSMGHVMAHGKVSN